MADLGPRPDIVLFDLDGTLIQSREAAWVAFAPIAERHGIDVTSAEEFHEVFSRNFSEGLRALCPDEATYERVKAEYFEVLSADYAPPLIPGMREVVLYLAERTTLAVVSSNTMAVVRRVLEDNGIATCFAHVFTGDINPSKESVIRQLQADTGYTLGRHCAPHYDETGNSLSATTSSLYLVTDTVGDIEEARRAGAIAIGVTWGMHTEAELGRAGADRVVLWPQELAALLGQGPALGTCTVPPQMPYENEPVRARTPSSTASTVFVPAPAHPSSRPTFDPPGGCRCGCGGRPPEEPGSSARLLDRVRAANAAWEQGPVTMAGTDQRTGDRPVARPPVDPQVRAAALRTSHRGPRADARS